MNLSDRSSGRATERLSDDLATAVTGSAKGADGEHPPVPHARVGRRQLAALRSTLSDRDLAVLRTVAGLHFATTRQLERVHFRDGHRSDLAAARAARRSLQRLHGLKLLDRLERRVGGVRAGSASFVLRLSSVGGRVLGEAHRRRSSEPSLLHLGHVLEVAELVVRMVEHQRTGGIDALDVETEPGCWRPYVGPHGTRVWLKPDLRLTVGRGEMELHWFVELDRSTEYGPALTRKLRAYLAAWRDGGELARAGVFPRVLWVVPDDQRAATIRGIWQGLAGVPNGMFLATTTDAAVEILAGREVGHD